MRGGAVLHGIRNTWGILLTGATPDMCISLFCHPELVEEPALSLSKGSEAVSLISVILSSSKDLSPVAEIPRQARDDNS
jgi:hypothetical protein